MAEALTVALANVEPLREEMILHPLAVGAHLILDDIEKGVRAAVALFPQLRLRCG
jgi:hypothetical protein